MLVSLLGFSGLTQGSSGDVIRHFGYDGHGSTRLLVDNTPTIRNTYGYEAYGTMQGGNPGMMSQPATNLLYAGEYYNPDMKGNLCQKKRITRNPQTAR